MCRFRDFSEKDLHNKNIKEKVANRKLSLEAELYSLRAILEVSPTLKSKAIDCLNRMNGFSQGASIVSER